MNPENALNDNAVMVRRRLAVALLMAAIVFGCGGGTDYHASGGIGGTGVSMGTVTDHGSIMVNGVRFDTQQAQILVEGVPRGQGDADARALLPVGREVVVYGRTTGATQGQADRVDTFHRVRGPLQSIATSSDADYPTLDVLGQTVILDAQTRWHPDTTTVVGLPKGTILEVSGPVDGDGAVHAGHITVHTPDPSPARPVSLKGTVSGLDPEAMTFYINGQQVDYSDVDNPGNTFPVDGASVAITGQLQEDILLAETLAPFAPEHFDHITDFALEGFLIEGLSSNRARLGAYTIHIDEQATFFDGLQPQDLVPGVRLQARGRLQNRILQVDTIRAADRIQLVSMVEDVDAVNRTLTLRNMSPLLIRTDEATRVLAGADRLENIEIDDSVRVHAHIVGQSDVLAAIILVHPAPGNFPTRIYQLEGPVTAIAGDRFDILEVPVDTTVNTGIHFYDIDEKTVSREVFLADLTIGMRVRVTGRWHQGQLIIEAMVCVR
ncbi:DUF5666 domain-containing protein [Desulfatitalea alkaliphila]|uniref:DUF5666 domain-containing protein n=1 Tax=Desulfatitalea alkaliphila TaxID=2929485 RepID=A0AA41R2F1_9BACT|nr:DUF5666 domain-containing protein [Desulfatitalea alkaliphila]MCJ8500035.1 DUF5666 domain-containing protein [Desulfatitalea alkaliphila]